MDTLSLLVIDAQNDFMDQDGAALPVPGALADMARLASFIDAAGAAITDITLTLDSHHSVGIERPGFWRTGEGGPVVPFTTIRADDLRAGRYRSARPQDAARVLGTLDALEAGGRYQLMVWPVHCEIGTWGHNLEATLRAAVNRWELAGCRPAAKVFKGMNPWTEAYSALAAEVPDPEDPATQLNRELIARLDAAQAIVVAGEASSHCVRATVEHLADHLPSGDVGKICLLTDCMSPVSGFEAQARAFLDGMAARGARLARAADLAAECTDRRLRATRS